MWCSLGCLCTLIIYFQVCIQLGSASSLYAPDDSLWELDSTNFQRIVLGKNNAWIIQFYNFWCGHCIRFSPTWKIFAKEIQNWRNVIDVAVVNCAEPENVKLCRDYDVSSYPTVKLFWTNMNGSEKGEPPAGARDVLSMQQSVITYLESNLERGVPYGWPKLQPVNVSNARELWYDLPENPESIYVFLESPNSFVGREVILDLSIQKHLVVRRVLPSNTDFINSLRLNMNDLNFPLLLKIRRTYEVEILRRFSKDDNSTFIRDQVFESVLQHARTDPQVTFLKKEDGAKVSLDTVGVYMIDLENALRYSFSQEIAVHTDISGDKLLALKAFILALKNYFPGKTDFMAYLSKLNNWTSHTKGNLTGEDFLNTVERLQENEVILPKIREWVGCKGSQQRYRGYPCSLWTLFHAMTVQAFDMTDGTRSYVVKDDETKVLLAIRGYVKYFFSCKECSQHFQAMAVDIENEVKSSRDNILWLWNAHNKVNKRLAGDVTEDPWHPKIQFPSKDKCPKCRISTEEPGEIHWDEGIVLRFLQHFYKKDNILEKEVRKPLYPFAPQGNVLVQDPAMGKGYILSPQSSLLLMLVCIMHWFQVQLYSS